MRILIDPDKGIPASLNLSEQGLFVIGYHQMKHWLWMTREDREAWEKDHPDAPRVFLKTKEKPEETGTQANNDNA